MLANAIGAEFRQVVERDHQDQPARIVVAERSYDTNADDLWDALTNPERLPRWFLPIEGDLELGGRYQLQGNAGGTITRCDPPEALDVTWEFGGGLSWVNVRLTAQAQGTHLKLEHIVAASDVDEHWIKFGPAAVGVGWDLSLLGLAIHIASGEKVDPEEFARWSAGDDGRAFMHASADAWAAAHIAGGEDPETARGMAERTAKFYTGG